MWIKRPESSRAAFSFVMEEKNSSSSFTRPSVIIMSAWLPGFLSFIKLGIFKVYMVSVTCSPAELLQEPSAGHQWDGGQQGSGLNHLFLRIKDVSLKTQENADGLGLRLGLLFHRCCSFAATLAFLLGGGGEKLLGLWVETLWERHQQGERDLEKKTEK